MRFIGELIVILGAVAVVMFKLMRHVVAPALLRRRDAQREEENARLDRLIESDRLRERTPPS